MSCTKFTAKSHFQMSPMEDIPSASSGPILLVGTGKRGHYERGLVTGDFSRISKISRFSRKWLDSPLFSTLWGFSKISRISKFSRISRKRTFLKRPLFQKTPFSEPELVSNSLMGSFGKGSSQKKILQISAKFPQTF